MFNDNIHLETMEKDLVNDSAYMLFYVRKDLAGANIGDVYPANSNKMGGMTEDDVERFMRKRDSGRCAVC